MSLKGGPALKRRLSAIKTVWKPIARKWGRADVLEMRRRVPVRTGRLRRSFRVTSVTGNRVRVGGHYTAYFVDAGPKPHMIKARGQGDMIFNVRGRTIFTRKVHHRGYKARPFRQAAAVAAMRQNPQAAEVIKLWNDAA